MISVKVENGGSRLRKDPNDPNALELLSNNLPDEGTTINSNIVAYYSSYPDSSIDSLKNHKQMIRATISSRCIINYFEATSVVTDKPYMINSGTVLAIPFSFEYRMPCALIQTYFVTVK